MSQPPLEHWLAKLPPDFATKEGEQQALIVGASTAELHGSELILQLDELELLLGNLGIPTIDRKTYNLNQVNKVTYIGPGQLENLKAHAVTVGANLLVFNDPLSVSQLAALREACAMDVLDRGLVITKIFEAHAGTAEAKAQIGLAKLRSQLPSLRGLGQQMSRTGAGIGSRGSGETEFERHRRKLSRQERSLKKKLNKSTEFRRRSRHSRGHAGLPLVALAGYTNSGKTTLLSALTGDKTIIGEDKLFATLDTKTRRLVWPDGQVALLTDTVGFIRQLPHFLEASFRSTLEEISEAELLLLVADINDPNLSRTSDLVLEILREAGLGEVPVILCLNKIDQLTVDEVKGIINSLAQDWFAVMPLSALTGQGVSELKELIKGQVRGARTWHKA